jgi:hypothetical protein
MMGVDSWCVVVSVMLKIQDLSWRLQCSCCSSGSCKDAQIKPKDSQQLAAAAGREARHGSG